MALAVIREGAGSPWVLVHGWGLNAAVWTPALPALASLGSLHRLDLPGHGHSPWDGRRRLQEWAEAALAAAPEGAVWVGWSLGGLVALEAALQAPEAVARLVVVASNPRFLRAPDWPCAMAAPVLHQFADELADDLEGTVRRFLALQMRGVPAARAGVRQLRQALEGRGWACPEALQTGLRLLAESDLRARLAELRVPCRWLLGEWDSLVPACLADGLAQLAPAIEVRRLPRRGHAPFLSDPQGFVEALAP